MNVTVEVIGNEGNRVIIIDDFMDNASELIKLAKSMEPFEVDQDHYYPGIKRIFGGKDVMADSYVQQMMHALAPIIYDVFNVEYFNVDSACFSLVTNRPETLHPRQCIPHFDNTDQGYFAVLHFLSMTPKGGTSFYRHKATGFENISLERQNVYLFEANKEMNLFGPPEKAYISESNDIFERIAYFEGRFNRVLIYKGSLLHSGHIEPDFNFSPDPEMGRLTTNIFIQSCE